MLKLLKYLRPFYASVLLVIALLFGQALCDLTLPDYMSNIVNVGIQQNGIPNAAPTVIRETEWNKVQQFLTEQEKKDVNQYYTKISKDSLSDADYKDYLATYSALDKETLYVLSTKDAKNIESINTTLGKAILTVSIFEKEGTAIFTAGNPEAAKKIPPNTDPFVLLEKIPADQKDKMLSTINDGLKNMQASMITQSAIPYLKNEYTTIGINLDSLQRNYMTLTGAKMVGIALLSLFFTVLVGYIAARVAAGLGKDLRRKVFRKVTNFSNAEFDKFSTASLITRSTNDIQQVQMLIVMLLRIVVYAPILGAGAIIKVLNTNTNMGWVIGVAIAAILTLIIGLFALAIPKFKRMQKYVDSLNLVTRESLIGMLVIRAFNTQKHEEKRFNSVNNDLTKTSLFINRSMSFMMPSMMLVMNGTMLLIVWVGAHRISDGVMQVGDMMAFTQYAMQIIMSFLMISMVSIMIPRAAVSAQRIDEVITTDLTIHDPESPKSLMDTKKGVIEFKDVTFAYPGAEEPVLNNINFIAKPGETTAFIGSTGSGKSTLINLIPRFYDVSKGHILMDGIDIRDMKQSELRSHIGYVPQKGLLFTGTIESNIKYGKKEASQEELEIAATIAQAKEFITSKPELYNTEIAQGGTNVSGGQKQRLAIARALVKDANVFIFDDSFSALDYKTDAALRKSLESEITDATVLIVAQRISTIRNADQIIVLDEGRIVGTGTHDQLMESCEVYQEIALSQLSREELSS